MKKRQNHGQTEVRFLMSVMGTLLILSLLGCATVGERAGRDPVTSRVGVYDPPPPGAQRVRVGVPPFAMEQPRGPFGFQPREMENMAADQITTLLYQTRRFDVIERTQLNQLLAEQDLEGIVRPGEMARMGEIRGVDYLLLGKVTGFRITAQRESTGYGVGRGWVSDQLGGVTGAFDREEVVLTTEMGVDLRLVEPSTGEIKAAHFSQFRQQDTAGSMGIDVAGIGGRGEAEVEISEDDAGRVMRMAFDDTLRKMMPDIDRYILAATRAEETAITPAPATPTAAAAFCGQCGNRLAEDARFCGSCGAAVK